MRAALPLASAPPTSPDQALRAGAAADDGRPIPADELHVWVVDTTNAGFGQLVSATLLDPQETARAQRLRRYRDRLVFVRVHMALRQILGGYLATPAHDVVYEYDCVVCGRPHGKPTARSRHRDGGVQFNLARSGELGVVVVAADGAVGVDVERLDQPLETTELLQYFAPAERDALAEIPDADERRRHCLVTWTRKEAYTKALGTGLTLALDEFEMTVSPEPPRLLRAAPGDEVAWTMTDLPLPEPYTGTVVAAGESGRVRFVTWEAPGGRSGDAALSDRT